MEGIGTAIMGIVWVVLGTSGITIVVIGFALRGILSAINELKGKIDNLPPATQNIIHLGLRDGSVTTDTVPVSLSVRPEDFKIRAETLYEILLEGFNTKTHPDVGVLAYCILDHAGLSHLLDGKSWKETQDALTRLLINGDQGATKRFLKTIAESIGRVPSVKTATKGIKDKLVRARASNLL